MSEYEVDTHLEGETDIEIDFDQYTDKQLKEIVKKILARQTITFEDIYVELYGETTVEIEPQDRY